MTEQKIKLKMIRMSEVQSQEIEWLWYPFIPYGKLTIIQGDPGDGKTTMVLNLAAKLSKGEALDENMKVTEPVNVIYQTAEDGLADTVKPRLELAGADCERIIVIDESDKSLVYIMTYEVDSIQSSEDYAFIRGQLLTFAEMEQYKVYEDEKYICFNVTELFYTDLRTHVESMISQRSDVYFDEQIWERVQNIYNYCMDKENLEGSFYYIDDGEPSTQGLSSMKLDSRGENGENSLAYLDTLRDNISQAILNKELNFVSSCWVDEASRTVKVGITEMKEEYIQRLKEF